MATLVLGFASVKRHGRTQTHAALQRESVEFLRALGSQSGVSVWQYTLVG